MSNELKEIDLKSRPYNVFNDMINIKDLDPNKFKIDKQSYKKILVYGNGYVMVKNRSWITINSVSPLHLIISKINECIEEGNGNKYLVVVLADKTKKILKIMKNLRNKIWDFNRSMMENIWKWNLIQTYVMVVMV